MDQATNFGAQVAPELPRSYRLRRLAGRLLFEQDEATERQKATVWCGRYVTRGHASLYRHPDGLRARFGGINTCGCLWTCPVCALTVANERRDELMAGMARWHKMGGHVFLLTLTLSHHARQAFADVLDALTVALQRFHASKAWRVLSEQIERPGSVRSIEVTYSDLNGWHPHCHELVFAKREPDPRLIERARQRWVRELERVGFTSASLTDTLEHSFDWRGGDKAGQYVAKYGREPHDWTAADELTRSHAKLGEPAARRAPDVHLTPFELVAWWGKGDHRAGALFREYADAIHGKRALVWSPRLKSLLGVRDLTDAELAAELGRLDQPVPWDHVASLTAEHVALIWSREAEAEVLRLGILLDPRPGSDRELIVHQFVESLRDRPPKNSGQVVRLRARDEKWKGWEVVTA